MAEPRYRTRRPDRRRRHRDDASTTTRERRTTPRGHPRRASRAPLVAVALALLLLLAGFFALTSLPADAKPARCLACHTKLPETPVFSHKTHAVGRTCRQCHANADHSRSLILRARLGLAQPTRAAVDDKDLAAVPPSGKPSKLRGHRPVVCSRCHDMRAGRCDTCHAAPKPPHYRARCTACHAPSRAFSKPKLTHPTFGAHTTATASCDACHTSKKGTPRPACRTCHQSSCGKGVTTMAGCLKCHKTGSTDRWVSAP